MNEKNTGPQPNAGKPRHYNRKPRQNKEVDALSQAVQSAPSWSKSLPVGEKKAKTGAEKNRAQKQQMRAASRRHSRQKTSWHRKQHQCSKTEKYPPTHPGTPQKGRKKAAGPHHSIGRT